MPHKEVIVFIHGIGSAPIALVRIIATAKLRGYRVLAWKYPSRRKPSEAHAKDLAHYLSRRLNKNDTKVHFITHSLGGHVLSKYLQGDPQIPLGRVVMIAPPLGGSEVVDYGLKWPFFEKLFGPVINELKTKGPNYIEVHPEVAVIAGSRSRWPWSRLFNEANDGKVSVSSTRDRKSVV